MILALVFMLLPLQRKVGDWIDRFFYMERVRFRTKLSEFSRALTELVDLDEVGKTTVHFITQTLHVDSVLFFFLKGEANDYRPIFGTPLYDEMRFPSQHPFVKRVESNGRAVDLEHLMGDEGEVEEIDDLIEKGWVAVAPIFIKERLLGYILLGKKRTEKDYTVEELELLGAFSNQAALALSRALIYQDMSLKDKQIMQAEKMAAIGELAAGIAHEIRNPLGIITGSAETVRKHEDQKIREEMTGYILEESTRINRLISTFLDFARPKEPKLMNCDLREVLQKTLLLLSPQAKTQGVEIRKEIPQKPLRASVDTDQMRQAFTNLGINALEAMPGGGILKITVLENARDKVSIRFSDTGNGIPKEVQSKIFDPFFTTKEGGTGLGLSIAHRIVTQHGGNLSVEGAVGKGSTFTIALPLIKGA
jgi:signal transduction histidine kinase